MKQFVLLAIWKKFHSYPNEKNKKIWRLMSFYQLIDILHQKSLTPESVFFFFFTVTFFILMKCKTHLFHQSSMDMKYSSFSSLHLFCILLQTLGWNIQIAFEITIFFPLKLHITFYEMHIFLCVVFSFCTCSRTPSD